jgi:hypothetical protein
MPSLYKRPRGERGEVRFVDPYTFGADGGTLDEQEVEMEVELPVSRRFLIEFEPAVTGVRPDGSSWRFASGDLTMIPEVMLYETKDISFSSGLSILRASSYHTAAVCDPSLAFAALA